MKKVFMIIASVILLTACNNGTESSVEVDVIEGIDTTNTVVDTTGIVADSTSVVNDTTVVK